MASRGRQMLKIMLLGDAGVGKTSILNQFVNHQFTDQYKATIGPDFSSKKLDIDGRFITLQIWDTEGQEMFGQSRQDFYIGTDICIIVYDITKPSSFENINKWIKEFSEKMNISNLDDFPFMILGNKSDLRDDKSVQTSEASKFAQDNHNMVFYEVSSKTSSNISTAFEEICRKALTKVRNDDFQIPAAVIALENKATFEKRSPYLHPSFFIKVITCLFALATLVYMIVLDKCLYEYVWRKPIHNGDIAATATSFLILTIIATVFMHLDFVSEVPFIGTRKLYQLITVACLGFFTLLFAFIFGVKNMSPSYKNELCNPETGQFYIYWEVLHKDDFEYYVWKQQHNGSEATKYFSNRTTKAGAAVLGLFIALSCLFSALLFFFYIENDDICTNNNDKPYESPLIDNKMQLLRAVFLGDSGAGKTSIRARINNNMFDENIEKTIGGLFEHKTFKINGKEYLINLWDTAGDEYYRPIVPMYCKNTNIVYFVFDLSKRSSFDSIKGWLELANKNCAPNYEKVLIGNKCDLPSSDWQVSKEEIESFAKEYDMAYFEVSAKNGTNINEAITSCLFTIKLNETENSHLGNLQIYN